MALLNVLIVEDELLIANHIRQCLKKEHLANAVIAKNYNEALICLRNKKSFDLAFLDVNLSGEKNGIDLANYINENYSIPFLYITSYTDAKTLSQLQETLPEAYISKPFNNADIIATVNIISNKLKKNKFFELTIGKTVYKINLDDLLYIKSDHVYIDVVFQKETISVRSSISSLLEKLPKGTLWQINRSVAVNPNFITVITNTSVTINNTTFKKSSKY